MPLKLTKEEVKKLGLRPIGKKHIVHVWLETLEKGGILYITRAEFAWKNRTPAVFIKKIEKPGAKKFTISESLNRMGWVVERVE
ncbi:MAG: hypothetical protein ABI855_03095 [Bacteroidota bacterium]